jgi:hypothetical protein
LNSPIPMITAIATIRARRIPLDIDLGISGAV